LLYLLALVGPRDAPATAAGERVATPEPLAAKPQDRKRSEPRELERGALVQPARARDAGLQRQLYVIVDSLASELRAALPAHPGFPDLSACMAAAGRPTDRCQTLIADVINYALYTTNAKARAGADKLGLSAALLENGARDSSKTAAAVLTDTVVTSRDPLERISALVLMRFDPALSEIATGELPEDAYRDLENRPLPEVQLVAERHGRQPVTGSRVDEFVRLATGADDRAQTAALLALGHAPTADRLHEVLIGLPRERALSIDMARAVGTCGLSCAQSVQYLMSSESAEARIAVYEALGLAPDSERRELVELALASAPAVIDEAERTTRDSLLDDALAN
jgi:hypothetical protein